MNEQSSRSYCSEAECFPEKSRWRWNEQVCQKVKCKTATCERTFTFFDNTLTLSVLSQVSTNEWHHAAWVYDGMYIKLYVDKVLMSTTPMTGKCPNLNNLGSVL